MIAVTYQGDSLTVGMRPYVSQPASWSAQVGRHVETGLRILPHQRLGRVVVFALGTNDYSEPPGALRSQLRAVRRQIGARCLVTASFWVRGPRTALNRELARDSDAVADWAGAVRSHQVHLVDGIHPRASGYRLRAKLVRQAVARCAVAQP